MQEILLVLFTLLAIICAVFAILKKFNSRFAFIALGIIFLFIATVIKGESILGDNTTGNMFLDIFDFIRVKMKDTAGGIGVTIMAGGAYVMFMNHLKAANVLANGAKKLLKNFKQPYLLLALVYLLGSALKLFITSQVALGMLFMVTMYPILLQLGVSRLSCVSTIIMCGFLDQGLNDSSAIFTAGVMDLPPMEYFTQYEGKVGLVTILVMAVVIPLYFKSRDKKEFGGLVFESSASGEEKPEDRRPAIYGFLPVIPLALVVAFSFIPSIKMDVITANVIGFVIAFLFELIRRRNEISVVTNLINDVCLFMADYFNKVVAMIIAAYIFSEGVKQLGGINILAEKMASIQGAGLLVMIALSALIFLTGALTGSGNAPFYAFGPLAPNLAEMLGISAQSMVVPMHLSGSVGRTLSPFCPAVIAIPAMVDLEITDVIKRCVVPVIIATACVLITPTVMWMF
ncbi:C4-dicarboxylate transporter DcuC [Romboutsia ilealis]|uniref:C4-dicarboxylate transporter DcuC n=1 Tax=Romboutsia ilealis TaxID=1115758 RepID=UPI0027300FBD|nr:C4-dicarboxylate transporter DcuC [Romboutsia ilealis]MCI8534879.1 C4-dicarboxylate transporter DcuC [Hungatella sp.]